MKKYLIAALLVSAATGAMAQGIDININLGSPGYYGAIVPGDLGRPPVIYAQPMIIDRSVRYGGAPTYLRVPPGHAKKWSKHCAAYNACGRPVYFVQDSWYNNTYAPHYRRTHDGRDFRLDERGAKDKGYKDDGHKDKGHKDKGHKDKGHKDKGGDHGKGHGNGKH